MKPTLKSCDGVPIEAIHRCVQGAFADYIVPMKLSLAQLRFVLTQRGFDPALSSLAYQGEEVVSFCLIGWDGASHTDQAYVIMAGTLPAYRQRGLSSQIFRSTGAALTELGVSTLRLEVIDGNEAALRLYEKIGFRRQRQLNCFTLQSPLARAGAPSDVELRRFDPYPMVEHLETFRDWLPSWQNDFASLSRVADQSITFGAFDRGQCIGYGILLEPTRTVAQLAVKAKHCRRGIGSAILRALSGSLPGGGPLWILNLDSRDHASRGFLEAQGACPSTSQAEMALALV